MKNAREDQRRVTLRYLHDAVTGRTTVTIDVEAPEDEMPHEHRRDLREMAEDVLGVPLSSLPEGVEVNLRPARGGHAHPHPHPHPGEEAREETTVDARRGVKA
jgi:hypothetical protein